MHDESDRIEQGVLVAVIAIAVLICSALSIRAEGFSVRVESTPLFEVTIDNPWYPPKPPPKAMAEKDERPIVYRLTAKWCGPCRVLEEYLTKEIKSKLPYRIVDWDVDAKGWMGAPNIPAFWWKSPAGNLRHPWKNIEDLTRTWEASQKRTPKATANTYTPRWTYPTEIRHHLQSVHGIAEANQLTPDEAERAHDQSHDALSKGYSMERIRSYARQKGLIK